SPDGRWLVYGTREGTETGLRIRDLTTGDERWLAYPVQRDDMEARATLDVLPGYSFTPDSRAVVVSSGGEIWRLPVDGSPGTKIPFEVGVQLDIGPEVKFTYHVTRRPPSSHGRSATRCPRRTGAGSHSPRSPGCGSS